VVQVVKIEEAKVQEKAAAAKVIKDECEAELSVAMPILQVCNLCTPRKQEVSILLEVSLNLKKVAGELA
jgi:hypothetical protein